MKHSTDTHTECVINPWALLKKCHWPAKALEMKLHNWSPMGCSGEKKRPENNIPRTVGSGRASHSQQ